jgi:DNA-binding transcriptional ArsR family regulator
MVADYRVAQIGADADIDRIFHALADATRRDILARTLVRDGSISQLAEAYLMSFAAVQKHVAVLERAGLVRKQKHGRQQLVRAVPETIRRADALLARYESIWRARAGAIDDLLAEPQRGAAPNEHPVRPSQQHDDRPTRGPAR